MSSFARWARWEMGRTIELNGVIVYIICERIAKAVVLIGGGIAILMLSEHDALRSFAENAQHQLQLSAGLSLWQRGFDHVLALFSSHPDSVALAAVAYGALELVEAAGLVRRRRWAEYLVFVATIAFLPLEVHALVHGVTPLRVIALLLNIAIAAYLVWRKQLFFARPGRADLAA